MILIPHYSQHPYYWDAALHVLYVEDECRVRPFEAAIKEIVKLGATVADIGTGTGTLARFALEAGASKAYGIESSEGILRVAKRVNQELAVNGSIELVHGDSRAVELPEAVDVVVAELIGGLGNDEAMSQILEDARQRHLKPGGTMIPSKVDVYLCPVECPEAHAQIPTVYDDDLIVPPDKTRDEFKAYYEILGLPPEQLLAEFQELDSIDLMGHTEMSYRREFSFKVERDGMFSGFAAWFKAQLTANVVLDTSPWAPCTCWGQAYFAVHEQVSVNAGDAVDLTFSAVVPESQDRPYYIWEGEVNRAGQVRAKYHETNQL